MAPAVDLPLALRDKHLKATVRNQFEGQISRVPFSNPPEGFGI
jgi:hypothetical protein